MYVKSCNEIVWKGKNEINEKFKLQILRFGLIFPVNIFYEAKIVPQILPFII